MSKNKQEQEVEEEPEYQEPTYHSTIGEGKEKELNTDVLAQLVNKAQNKKKGKKNRKGKGIEPSSSIESIDSVQSSKKKKIVITDMSEIEKINFGNLPKSAQVKDEHTETKVISQLEYKNSAILATTPGQINESDIRRFFNGLSISKIYSFPGYYIIEFSTEDDLRKALQKNKTKLPTNVTVLIDEYSIEDENPKPEKHDPPRYSHYDNDDNGDYYGNNNYSNTPQFNLGSKSQSNDSNIAYQSSRRTNTPIFKLGSRFNQQIDTSSKEQSQAPKYQPPSNRYQSPQKNEPLPTIQKKENSFGILKDDE